MSCQKIIVINTGHAADFGHKEFSNVDELRVWMKEAVETMDLSENIKVFVGEERCLEITKGRASYSFNLSKAGCGCGKNNKHDPKAWDLKHGITDGVDYESRN